MEKSNNFIWMPLIGFDRDKEDKGVNEYLGQTGFIPQGMSVFLFHSDIINQHEGMDKEFTLHPDNCSYYGAPRNEFRERQPWTNYDLRDLAHNLADTGIEAYVGVMGVYLDNTRHQEWESDHPELMSFGCNGRMNLNVLKRFKDGTYYEDFFAEKTLAVLQDYGFAGVHVSDFFCPPEHSICNGDFSTDMLEQFTDYSKVELPENITSRLGFDEQEDIDARQDYIWNNLRHEWINFYAWRWEKFWGKVAAKLHPAGKKIMINNAWCADPFEALYRYGIDYKRLYDAGVDYIVSETVPEGLELVDCTRNLFRQLMAMPQFISAFAPEGNQLTLLGVKDCTEEWDMLHHAPMRLERDMYMLSSLFYHKDGKFNHSTKGYMVTLGDGITKDEWEWIGERNKIAWGLNPQKICAPTIIWSDKAHYSLLDEYIKTRRPSSHKLTYTMQNNAVSFGAIARIEDIDTLDGALFVPNFDLLPEDEKQAVLSYKKAPVVCIAVKEYLDGTKLNYDICVEDKFATHKLCVFAFNLSLEEEQKKEITACFDANEQVCNDLHGEPSDWVDPSFFTTLMPFVNMSKAFINAVKTIFEATEASLFHSDRPIITFELENGDYRIYVLNPVNNYNRAPVYCDKGILDVKSVSKYPLLPVKYLYKSQIAGKGDGAKAFIMQSGGEAGENPRGFIGKVPPLGISIFDVKIEK